jgi:hypothetical protein
LQTTLPPQPQPVLQVQPQDRVAGARGQHVVHIRINIRRMPWKLKKTGVNASVLRAANTRFNLYVFITP